MDNPSMNPRTPAGRAYLPRPSSPPQNPKVNDPSMNPRTHGRRHRPSTAPLNPKVVSIPVPVVGSDDTNSKKKPAARPTEADRLAAAVRIQKVVRGYLVRKKVRTVRKVAAEAEEIAKRIEAEGEAIRRDDRERLRVWEMLMALLLRIDAVSGVREYRKKVIRRVIQLQKAVDSIADAAIPADRVVEAPESTQNLVGEAEESFMADPMEETPDYAPQESSATAGTPETKANNEEAILSADSMEEDVVAESPFASRKVEESMIGYGTKVEEGDEMQGVVSPGVAVAAENSGMKELMEKCVAETERLRGVVARLCERVEQLERTVQWMKPKKEKQQTNHAFSPCRCL